MKQSKCIAFILMFALILQIFAMPINTVFASESGANNDFESVSGNAPAGWSAKNAVISSDNSFWHSGNHSAKIEKSDLDESEVTTDSLELIEKDGVNGDFTLEFAFWYRAKNANVFMRLDALVYDSGKNLLKTLTGNIVMLPRSDDLCEWTQLSTREKVSSNAAYISYKIVLTGVNSVAVGDRATVYVDDITCKPVETFSEYISDYCDFHSLDESGEVSGWSVKDGTFTTNNGAGMFYGTSTDSTLTYKSEKLSPECSYQISAKYTSSADFTAGISYYGINGEILKTDSIELSSSNNVSKLFFETSVPDALYSVFFMSGNAGITLDDLYFFKTSTRVSDSFSGWTADSIWYPEDAKTEAYYQFRYFRVTFQLDSAVNDAFVQMAFDDSLSLLYVNGSWVSTSPYKTVRQQGKKDVFIYDIASKLTTGKNVIALKVLNCGMSAGLVLESYIHTKDNKTYHLTANPQNTKVSRLNCTSPHENDYASFNDVPSNWKSKTFNDTLWETPVKQGIPPYSNLGSGEVAFAYQYSDFFCFTPSSCPTVNVNGGEQKTTSIAFASCENSEIPETVTGNLYDGNGNLKAHIPMSVSLVQNSIDFSYSIPDYLPSGNYSVKLYEIGITGDDETLFNVILNHPSITNPTASAVKEKGSVKLKVNGKAVSPVMYMRPANAGAYYNYSVLSTMENSELPIYCTYNGYFDGSDGSQIWTGDNQIDYNTFDDEIYKTLDLCKDKYIIVNLALDAPGWWLAANPDEVQKDAAGNAIGKVSFASQKYRNDASGIIKSLVEHALAAAYSHRIIGVRLTAGKTNEWMNYLKDDDNGMFCTVDYSTPMKNAFKAATGYNNIPSISNRATGGFTVLDSSDKADVIAYNKFLSQCVTDSFLFYAQAVKTVAPDILVGGYNGYMWFENSSLGIGTSHTTANQVLSSEYVDFVSSPVNYSERINGFATGYMTLTDSIAAHGKLYIAEQDNRTIYGHIFGDAGSDNAVGLCNTLSDSINQITRDLSTDLISGSGFWLYDMEGGWFNSRQMQSRIKALKNEFDYSLNLDMSSNSRVAVFVGDDTYDYLNSDIYSSDNGSKSTRLLSQLYTVQRLELSKMGAPYDTFAISDLTSQGVDVDWSQYKLIIMLSPFNISNEERNAISDKFKKNNNYILWVYLPGYSNGSSNSAENISSLVDMTVSVASSSNNGYALYSEITDNNYGNGMFGSSVAYKTPRVEITGGYTGVIAEYADSLFSKTAMAYKTLNDYTSVYSAVPGVPATVLRKLCLNAGVHIYSNDSDIVVNANKSYISVNSAYPKNQTVLLDDYYNVFDVLDGSVVSYGSNTIDVTLSAGETKLYRLEKVKKPREYDGGLLTNGDFYLKWGSVYEDWSVGNASVSGGNAVQNGDFESDFDYWSKNISGNATVTIVKDTVASGENAVKMTLLNDWSQAYLQGYQFSVEPSTAYELSYKLKIDYKNAGNNAQCYAFLYTFDENGAPSGGLIDSTGRWNTVGGDYETVTYEFTTPSNTKTARIDLMHNGVAGTSYWDDVKCVKKDSTVGKTPVLEESSKVANGVMLSGNGAYISCSTLASRNNSSYILSFDALIQNSGKVLVTVYRSDKETVVKSAEIPLNNEISHQNIVVPSANSEEYYLKITLKDAYDDSSLHIGNITMITNRGDFYRDNLISADDFVIMVNAVLGVEEQSEIFDLNGDLFVDILDLVMLKKYCANII